jgi:hypothetical protein
LAERKCDGMKLGWPVRPSKNFRLVPLADKIEKRLIAKLLDVLPNTLYASLKVRKLVG